MQAIRASELVPVGVIVDDVAIEPDSVIAVIRAAATNCHCPLCGVVSYRVHSRYERTLADLPVAGQRTRLVLRARRFFCDGLDCFRRFEGTIEPRARRTSRLHDVVHCLAIVLGGKPAAALSRCLSVDVSNDALAAATGRRRGIPDPPPPSIVGINDRAWRRNHRYGTLICDLEPRRTAR